MVPLGLVVVQKISPRTNSTLGYTYRTSCDTLEHWNVSIILHVHRKNRNRNESTDTPKVWGQGEAHGEATHFCEGHHSSQLLCWISCVVNLHAYRHFRKPIRCASDIQDEGCRSHNNRIKLAVAIPDSSLQRASKCWAEFSTFWSALETR